MGGRAVRKSPAVTTFHLMTPPHQAAKSSGESTLCQGPGIVQLIFQSHSIINSKPLKSYATRLIKQIKKRAYSRAKTCLGGPTAANGNIRGPMPSWDLTLYNSCHGESNGEKNLFPKYREHMGEEVHRGPGIGASNPGDSSSQFLWLP